MRARETPLTEAGPGVLWCQVHHVYEPSVCWMETRRAVRWLAEVLDELGEDRLSSLSQQRLHRIHFIFGADAPDYGDSHE
jgi:hypothetical protein